jgi:hypothetical protein
MTTLIIIFSLILFGGLSLVPVLAESSEFDEIVKI